MLQCVSAENVYSRLKRLIAESVRAGQFRSEAELLRRVELSTGYMAEFRRRIEANPEAGLTGDVARRFAEALGVSEGFIIRGEEELVPELLDVLPERAQAVDAARKLKFPEAAIRAVLRESPPPGEPPSALYWFRRIETEAERVAPTADSGRHKL